MVVEFTADCAISANQLWVQILLMVKCTRYIMW